MLLQVNENLGAAILASDGPPWQFQEIGPSIHSCPFDSLVAWDALVRVVLVVLVVSDAVGHNAALVVLRLPQLE